MEVKRQILASQISVKRTLKNEKALERELSKFFKRLQKEVLSALEEYWSEYQLLQGQINLMVAPVHEAHREYYEILEKYVRREYKLGQAEAKRNVERLTRKNRVAFKATISMPIKGFINHNKYDLFETSPRAERDLLDRTFRASEQTMSRVDNQINNIITEGYRSGKGINDIGAQLNKRFDQLSSWESRRIARTEVNTSHNVATRDTYKDMGVEYTQWIAASDDRTRDSHLEVDGEIIPIDGKYCNGLGYPGDMSGPVEEWINCRCSNAPFVVPFGYMAPSFSPFRESDLIPIETENPLEKLQQEPQMQVPTDEQLKANLTKQELEQVRWAKDVQTSEYISDTGKAMARDKLNELYSKALKKPLPKPEKVPPQTVDSKPLKPKTKTVEEQPVKPKAETKPTSKSPDSMTSQELYESMTKADKKKYDKFKGRYESGKKYGVRDIIERNLNEMRKLEQKQREKLKNKGKRKQQVKTERDSTYEKLKSKEPLWENHKKESTFSSKSIETIEKWADKKVEGKVEWGYRFNTKTGELMGRTFKGGRSGVTLKGGGPEVGSIHVHTNELSPWPSGADIKAYRCDRCSEHYVISKHEVWYIHAEESFGMMGRLVQTDIDAVYTNVVYESNEYLKKQLTEGKLKPDEKSIKTASDIDIGNRLIKEFSKKKWKDKGLIVERYLR